MNCPKCGSKEKTIIKCHPVSGIALHDCITFDCGTYLHNAPGQFPKESEKCLRNQLNCFTKENTKLKSRIEELMEEIEWKI